MFIQICILILGFVLLISGANALVKGASEIAKKFHVSEILIGLTIVALGTSLPELIVTIISASTNSTNIIVGNVIGSNLCNLLLIFGIISIIKPLQFEKESLRQNFPLLHTIILIVLLMGLGIFSQTKLVFTQIHGIILLLIAFVYFLIPILDYLKIRKNNKSEEANEEPKESNFSSLLQNIIYLLLGGVALKYGGDFVVDSAINIAYIMNIPERLVSLTIVALGTSLPELVTCIVAIIKHDDDIAEGNIIGSCIINFCLILGLGATLSNLPLEPNYIENLFLLLVSSVLIWLYGLANKNNTLTRANGIVLLVIYLIYCIRLFV